jgi:hypothetical protein
MIARKHPQYGNLVFDRDAIVRAALRAYFEGIFADFPFKRLSFAACALPSWTGDLQRGAFCNDDRCGNYDVVGWTEAGVVGLAYALGWGPIENLDLPVSAVTGGPDDVRRALPGLPDELEPALVLAAGMLLKGQNHGERLAGVGFWLHGDRVGGTLFDAPVDVGGLDVGARQLAMWGLLLRGRLLPPSFYFSHPENRAVVVECARREAPIHALMDAVVDRRLGGPTELTPEELAMLALPSGSERPVYVARMLKKVGITWPGSPEIPEPPPPKEVPNPFFTPATNVGRDHPLGYLGFDHDPIVRAALRAYLEAILSQLDPLERHKFTACVVPGWTGDVRRGAFFNGNGRGDYDVIAWTEAGIVGLTYQRGYGPLEQLGLSTSQVTGGPDDVRGALPGLPAELSPALVLAAGLLEVGAHGERLAGVGFWLHGDRVEGTLFDNPTAPGVFRLACWGQRGFRGRLERVYEPEIVALMQKVKFNVVEPIEALADAVAARAFAGPTELTTAELALLLPTPPDPSRLLDAQRMLQKVGITWPGSPEIPEPPPRE